jgi:signal transduction histidine kinase
MQLPESYDLLLVALSYLVSFAGSYTALSMVARLSTPGGRLRVPWLLGAAFAQGTAIWSMHFAGMLALDLSIPIAYYVALVALSLVIAGTGSLLALFLTQRKQLDRRAMIAGGIFIGAGIVGLHYINMAAMRMPALTRYSPVLVLASILVAVVFGLLSLMIGRRYQHDDPRRSVFGQLLAAAIMGVAITGMHYTGIEAASFYAVTEPPHQLAGPALPASVLPKAVLLSTLVILAAALASAAFDRRISARASVSRRLLAAQESERRRIARVLHDDVGQLLTAVRLNLQRHAPSERRERAIIGETIELVDEALIRVRALSVELRPSVLDDLGLGDAVAWYATRQAERAGYDIVVDQALGDERLPEEIETAGFRIIQQALTNIARHAEAKHVRIRLWRDEQAVELTVDDDGVGFDVRDAQKRAQAGESLGLVDMAEQAGLAGGSLAVVSGQQRGSTVRVRFPMDSAA